MTAQTIISGAKDLRDVVLHLKKSIGVGEEVLAEQVAQANDTFPAFQKQIRQKANEVEHTTNTGYGAELIPTTILSQTVMDLIPTYSKLLPYLPGFQGNGMGKSEERALVGEFPYAQGIAEWTTGNVYDANATQKLPTATVTINQEKLIIQVGISDAEMNYSVGNLEQIVMTKAAISAAQTIDSAIINGDPTTASTGNVNSDDQAPATTFSATGGALDHRLLGWTGIRKTFLDGTSTVDFLDVGTLAWTDFMDVRGLMGDLSMSLDDLLLIINPKTYTKALTLDEFLDASINGFGSTVQTGQLPAKVAGTDLYVAREWKLTEADGKQSATGSSNTKGGFGYILKKAIQRGYGQPIEMQVTRVLGRGYLFTMSMDFGYAIANKLAGQADPAIVGAINATV